MLQSLSVKNFILIDELEIEFDKGLCVITGETGAGKSVLLDAILFSLGGKFTDEVIRQGSDYCSVATIFTVNSELEQILQQCNIEYTAELVIKRIQKFGNRKKFLINDQVVTQNILQQITDYLFELHGQNSHTSLLTPSSHIDVLDDYGNSLNLRAELFKKFTLLQEITKEITKITKDRDNIEQEIDYLAAVTEELKSLAIEIGEEEKLVNIRRDLQNYDKKVQIIQDIFAYINNPEINKSINNAQRIISRNLGENEQFAAISLNLEDCYNSLEEARTKLGNLVVQLDENDYHLDEVEERLFKIRDIIRKYNISCDKIPEFLVNNTKQLEILKNKINNVENQDNNRLIESKKYFELAELLAQQRNISARKLELAMQQELEQLKMEKTIFKVEITTKDYSSHYKDGIDNIRFIASTNLGTKLAPIDQIASGGELSRFMLALKTCLFDKSLKTTIIFDEIDTGIGGIVADKVGERLKKLSSVAQIIIITHQPQVACKADQHILVEKLQYDQTTKITARNLQFQERRSEIARMISGKSITDAGLKAAEELLNC